MPFMGELKCMDARITRAQDAQERCFVRLENSADSMDTPVFSTGGDKRSDGFF